jgi:hypothetical protein
MDNTYKDFAHNKCQGSSGAAGGEGGAGVGLEARTSICQQLAKASKLALALCLLVQNHLSDRHLSNRHLVGYMADNNLFNRHLAAKHLSGRSLSIRHLFNRLFKETHL